MTSPAQAKTAHTSLVLSLPFAILALLAVSGFEPDLGFLVSLTGMTASRLGSLVIVISFLLLVAGTILSLRSVIITLRAGEALRSYWMNSLLTLLQVSVLLWVLGSTIVDQYPCWIGVPNCD